MAKTQCEVCGAPYQLWQAPDHGTAYRDIQARIENGREPLMVPTCDCARLRLLKEHADDIRQSMMERGLRMYSKLNFGEVITNQMRRMSYPQGIWNSPMDALNAHSKLIIQGSVGHGKSSLLKKIAVFFCINNIIVSGGYVPLLLKKMKSFETQDETYDWLMNGSVLVLDDLDKLLGSRIEVEHLLTLVEHYNSHGKSILVTMNTSWTRFVEELTSSKYLISKEYAEALVSRLKENAVILHMDGKDFRTPDSELNYEG